MHATSENVSRYIERTVQQVEQLVAKQGWKYTEKKRDASSLEFSTLFYNNLMTLSGPTEKFCFRQPMFPPVLKLLKALFSARWRFRCWSSDMIAGLLAGFMVRAPGP